MTRLIYYNVDCHVYKLLYFIYVLKWCVRHSTDMVAQEEDEMERKECLEVSK